MTWTDLGQSAKINAYYTVTGRSIGHLCPYNGHIALGYGDSSDESGQGMVGLVTWDGSQYVTHVEQFWVNEIANIRVIDGILYVVGKDPQFNNPSNLTNQGPDYATWDGTTWTIVDKTPPFSLHLYDIVKWNGALWLPGVKGVSAMLHKSVDNGATWIDLFTINPSGGNLDFCRFYAAVPTPTGLWVQRWDAFIGTDSWSWKSTTGAGGSFVKQTGVSLVGGGTSRYPWGPVPVAGGARVLLGTGEYRGDLGPTLRVLYRFDGTGPGVPAIDGANDVLDWFGADDGTVWILKTNRRIQTTTDGLTFTTVATDAPVNAISICAVGQTVWVGTTDSHLWQSGPSPTTTTTPAPTTTTTTTTPAPTTTTTPAPTTTTTTTTPAPVLPVAVFTRQQIASEGAPVESDGAPVTIHRDVVSGSAPVVTS